MRDAERVPTFIIGGAPRSGTTFLCHALARHPDVYIAEPYIPEPKVFLGREKSHDEYLALYRRLFASAHRQRALGEKTSRYLESADACRLIKEHLPSVRIMFVLREPVERAYSNFLWSTKNGLETLSFEEAIRLEGEPRPLPSGRASAAEARPFDYLSRGQYDVLAERYHEAFGAKAIRFFLYEDLVSEPERVLTDMQRFIGVEPRHLGVADLGLINAARDVGPPIAAGTHVALRRRMAPSVRRFQALTGVCVDAWGYDRAT
jgi:sulfotransferase family protein